MRETTIRICCKETLYTYNIYHIVKAFFPGAEIEQSVDTEQEPLVILETEGGSCFSVTPDMLQKMQERGETPHLPGNIAKVPAANPNKTDMAQERKRRVTRLVYEYIAEQTGRKLAWGMLTGVRPTKLAMQIHETGRTKQETIEFLKQSYAVSDKKARLAMEIAGREKTLLGKLDCESGFSLYVGIPFCPSICSYCSFSSSPIALWEERVNDYLDALCKEIVAISEQTRDKKLNTIYIGGGTPTTLEAEQLERLLSLIDERFSYEHLTEYTVEAGRPDSITREKLEAIRRHPVTRISVNPQTMQQRTLDRVGRRHTVQDVKDIFRMARELGFDNINMDLIAGLPGESAADMRDTLRQIEELGPDSLTVHSLAIKRAAKMGQEQREKRGSTARSISENMETDRAADGEPTMSAMQEELTEMIEASAQSAERMGLLPYYLYRQKNIAGNFENVGYAKVDKAGIYNILIMEEKQTIYAAGAGATTKIVLPHKIRLKNGKETNLIRTENVKSITGYICRIDEMIEKKEWNYGIEEETGHRNEGYDAGGNGNSRLCDCAD